MTSAIVVIRYSFNLWPSRGLWSYRFILCAADIFKYCQSNTRARTWCNELVTLCIIAGNVHPYLVIYAFTSTTNEARYDVYNFLAHYDLGLNLVLLEYNVTRSVASVQQYLTLFRCGNSTDIPRDLRAKQQMYVNCMHYSDQDSAINLYGTFVHSIIMIILDTLVNNS